MFSYCKSQAANVIFKFNLSQSLNLDLHYQNRWWLQYHRQYARVTLSDEIWSMLDDNIHNIDKQKIIRETYVLQIKQD